mmetsp:Transcript_34014/g.55873  ORF Transcript_34014/g.55873 Transcript_34014/m.55873 type:complete len:146 (-) Transcript_34014:105-542(-)
MRHYVPQSIMAHGQWCTVRDTMQKVGAEPPRPPGEAEGACKSTTLSAECSSMVVAVQECENSVLWHAPLVRPSGQLVGMSLPPLDLASMLSGLQASVSLGTVEGGVGAGQTTLPAELPKHPPTPCAVGQAPSLPSSHMCQLAIDK